MKTFLSAILLSSTIIGGTVGTAFANDNDTLATVTAVNQTWNQTFNKGDSEALSELYVEDATLSPGNGEVLVGREQIAQLFKSFLDNGVNNHRIETINTYHSGNQIVQLGRWKADGVNDKQETITFGGVLVTVLEQNEQGDWEVKSHVWNMGS
ncbi:hypothetical protein LCGC14_1513860 [marine sediment metagenome]|uniref:DUF4440 domain-containing protein n=1 Tax=marine sediment metagenome TaxID=412755 RepID=A0A0F9M1Q3_9ZZZZ